GLPKCSLKIPAWDNISNALPRLHIPAMPAVRSKRGWCGCLQDDEPPEITYCVVENTGTLTLQAITPTQPMPSQEELDVKFAELVIPYMLIPQKLYIDIDIQLLGCVNKSKLDIIQRFQNKILRRIGNAPWHHRNIDLHMDLEMNTEQDD
uniref:Uncharacterized protein LOC114334485 n=1 Tax=Diabrotica virgifera virgifera TaxID=50390 RepID=A0A6P7FV36_DIAVI